MECLALSQRIDRKWLSDLIYCAEYMGFCHYAMIENIDVKGYILHGLVVTEFAIAYGLCGIAIT